MNFSWLFDALKIGGLVTIAVFSAGLLCIEQVNRLSRDNLLETTSDGLENLALSLAAQVDPQLHEAAEQSQDSNSEEYEKAIKPLFDAHRALPEVEYIYTFRSDGKKIWFVLDTATRKEKLKRDLDPSKIGEIYHSSDPKHDENLADAIQRGKLYSRRKIVHDSYGDFLSAFAPVPNTQGISLGVDISAKKCQSQILVIEATGRSAVAFLWIVAGAAGTLTGLLTYRNRRNQETVIAERIARSIAEEEKKSLAHVAENTHSAVVTTDWDGKITWVNKSFTTLTGWTLSEARGKKPGELLQKDSVPECTLQSMRDAIRNRTSFAGEIYNHHKNGHGYWALLEISPMHQGFLGLQTDITQRKEREARLKEAKLQAEAANNAKSEFLAVMSHEIRTPLNGVIGYCNLLQDTRPGENQTDYLQGLQLCSENLLEIINDILNFSRIEAGHTTVDLIGFIPKTLINKIVNTYQILAEEKGIKFVAVMEESLNKVVISDPKLLQQILVNLINNAIKFTQRGSIQLECGWNSGVFWAKVEDTGIGIPSESREKVFQPFSQADSSTTRKYGGTGLGLSISRKLAETLGGKLTLLDKTTPGTLIKLEVPAPPGKIEKKETETHPTKPTKVLVVEDNQINQKVLSLILRKAGHQCQTASSGQEGIDKALAEDFDLILMDVQMPGIDGIEATQKLRTAGLKTPIFAVTADAQEDNRNKCLQAGMQGFVSKPYTLSDIQAAIGKSAEPNSL